MKRYDMGKIEYTDESVITFGLHKGKRLIDIPASYLIYLYDNGLTNGPLGDYIKENMDVLRKEK